MSVNWSGISTVWIYGLLAGKKPQAVKKALDEISRAGVGDGSNVKYEYTDANGAKRQGYVGLMQYALRDPDKEPAATLKEPDEKKSPPESRAYPVV